MLFPPPLAPVRGKGRATTHVHHVQWRDNEAAYGCAWDAGMLCNVGGTDPNRWDITLTTKHHCGRKDVRNAGMDMVNYARRAPGAASTRLVDS